MSRFYIIFITLFSCSYLVAQSSINPLDTLADDFNSLTPNSNQDAIYFQTDKDIYRTDENLWFKAYVLDAQYLFPSKRDNVLFVQLINDATEAVVWEERYEIENGFVDGHIYINNKLAIGTYSLTAFTQHSYFKNQENFYALKKVSIFNNSKTEIKPSLFKNNIVAQFSLFAEGGYLVSNLNNKLAFKALNKEGLPVDVSGVLFENDNPIKKFKSFHEGMGYFMFKPDATKNYHIVLNQQKKISYKLPEIKNSGKTLSLVSNSDTLLKFKITQSENLAPETVYLRLQIKGVIYQMACAPLTESVMIALPLKDLPQGIAEVTLFNSNLQPIAERLVYVKLNEQLKIKSTISKSEYETREKVVLRIKTTNSKNKPVVAHLGLSVFDRAYKDKLHPKNILSHYHLSTQLNGSIYNPSFYFNRKNKNRKQALDLLMLTQGWRRYVWNEDNLKLLSSEQNPLVYNNIEGSIIFKRKNENKFNIPFYIGAFSGDTDGDKKIIKVDSLNNFKVTHEHFKLGEKGYFYSKLYTVKNAKSKIALKDESFNAINKNRNSLIEFYPKYKKNILEQTEVKPFIIPKGIKLNAVNLETTLRDKFMNKLDSLAKFEFNPDFICHINHLNCPYHRGNRDMKPKEGVVYFGVLFQRNGSWIMTEEQEKGEPNKIVTLPPYSYTKYSDEQLLEMFNLVRIKGYYGKREFYNPVYDKISIDDPFPDYRNTLFWKPNIITDTNGEATVEFHCSDIKNTFIGNVEGVTEEGLLGNDNFIFKVIERQ